MVSVNEVFNNGPGDRDIIPDRVIPKTQKMVFDSTLLNTQNFKVRIKGKWSYLGRRVVLFPTRRCSSYSKGSLRIAPDNGHPIYIYIPNYDLLSVWVSGVELRTTNVTYGQYFIRIYMQNESLLPQVRLQDWDLPYLMWTSAYIIP